MVRVVRRGFAQALRQVPRQFIADFGGYGSVGLDDLQKFWTEKTDEFCGLSGSRLCGPRGAFQESHFSEKHA